MILQPDTVQKILDLGSGEAINRGFLSLFEAVANDAENQGLPSGTMVIPFYNKESGLQPGDWAAELHFVVRKVESINDQHQSDEEGNGHATPSPESPDQEGTEGRDPPAQGGPEAGSE